MAERTLQKKMTDLLDGLPESAEEIRKRLKRSRYKGDRGNRFACPLANYLTKKMGLTCFDDVAAVVDTGRAAVVTTGGTTVCDVYLSGSTQEFVKRFDNGEYPELDNAPRQEPLQKPLKKGKK